MDIKTVKKHCLDFVVYINEMGVFSLTENMNLELEKKMVFNFLFYTLFREDIIKKEVYLEAVEWNKNRDRIISEDPDFHDQNIFT